MRRGNRWNTIGATRVRLAAMLTEYLTAEIHTRAREALARPLLRDGDRRVWEEMLAMREEVDPARLSPMRLVGLALIYEDAHTWEGWSHYVRDGRRSDGGRHFLSYCTMTEIVRAGGLEIGAGDYVYPVSKKPVDTRRASR